MAQRKSTGSGIDPARRLKYIRAREQGQSKSAAARLAGICRETAYGIEDGLDRERQRREQAARKRGKAISESTMASGRAGHGNVWANGYTSALGQEDLPDPKLPSEISTEAKRALGDFGYFRARYFGRARSPWQEQAGTRMLELLESPEKTFVVVNCPPGCLAGDTLIRVNRGGASRCLPIRDLVTKFNGGTLGRHGEKGWNLSIPTMVPRAVTGIHDGFYLRLVPVVRAVASGVKVTYTLTTDSGRSIRATADHRFAIDGGEMVPLRELCVGDWVLVDGGKQNNGEQFRPEYHSTQGLVNHPHAGAWRYRQPTHRLVVEAELNGLPLDWYIALLRDPACETSSLKFLEPSVAVHHRNRDTLDNDIGNLKVVEHREHSRQHGLATAWANCANHVVADRIASIEEYGEEETFDLSVADDPHNFVAGGFVVHNSGKTTIFTHDLVCWLIARNRSVRIMLGSRTFNQATRYSGRVRRSLQQRALPIPPDEQLRKGLAVMPEATLIEDFGRFRPDDRISGDVWQKGGFIVAQPGDLLVSEKEPTVAAFGFDGDVLGTRIDVAIWDDLVDYKNTRTADQRDELVASWEMVAEKRLEPGGLLILQGQRLAANDFYRYVLDQRVPALDDDGEPILDERGDPLPSVPKYHHIVYPAHDEACCKGQHGLRAPAWDGTDEGGCLLDPQRLTWKDLAGEEARHPDKYRVLYQQEDLDPASQLVPSIWIQGGRDPETGEEFPGCLDKDRGLCRPPRGLSPPVHSYATLDPAQGAGFWAFQHWLYHPESERRYLIDLARLHLQAPELLDWHPEQGRYTGMMEVWQARSVELGLPIRHWVVEQNSAQRFLFQYDHVRRWTSRNSVTIVPHQTSRNKTDEDRGVETIRNHYRFGRVRLPWAGPETKAKVNLLIKEVTLWPDGATDDQVLAQWMGEWHLPRLYPQQRKVVQRQPRPSWLRAGPSRRGLYVA